MAAIRLTSSTLLFQHRQILGLRGQARDLNAADAGRLFSAVRGAGEEQCEAVDVLELDKVKFESNTAALSHTRIQIKLLLCFNAASAVEI